MEVTTMASEKITAIVESVKTTTVLELKELVDTICEEFGVSAVAAAAPAAAGGAARAKSFISSPATKPIRYIAIPIS